MANSVIPSVNKINNSGGSRYYILNRSQLLKIQNFLMDGSFLNSLHLLFDNANQYVVGLKVFPCNISTSCYVEDLV